MENTTKGRDPHAVFAEIQNRVTAAGVSSRQLSKLKSIKILTKKKHSKKVPISNTWRVWAVIAAITSGVFLYFGLHTREGFSRLWFYLENTNPSNEFCTLDVPALVQNAFMPPVDCNICRNLTRVEKISKITPLEFESRFAYKGVPVVITDAMTNWTAPEVFNFTFFKSLYSFEGLQHECQFFPYQTEFKNLSEVFTMNMERALMLDKSNPWYVGWSNCDPIVSSTLRKYYNRPYFLPEDSEGSTLDWIFIGAPGYGANMHVSTQSLSTLYVVLVSSATTFINKSDNRCGSAITKPESWMRSRWTFLTTLVEARPSIKTKDAVAAFKCRFNADKDSSNSSSRPPDR